MSFFHTIVNIFLFFFTKGKGQRQSYSNAYFLVEIQNLCISLLSHSNYIDLGLLNQISPPDQHEYVLRRLE